MKRDCLDGHLSYVVRLIFVFGLMLGSVGQMGAPAQADVSIGSSGSDLARVDLAQPPSILRAGKLIPADDVEGHFGGSTAISGNIAVVGAPRDAVGGEWDKGSVSIFARNQGGTNNWGLVTVLTADDGEDYDGFGGSVAISEDVVVVGATGKDIGEQNGQGAAYIFDRDQGGANNWGQVTRLTASDGQENDWFGTSVAVNRDIIMVGARGNDLQGTESAIYVFDRDQGGANNWGLVTKLIQEDPGVVLFGASVALSEDEVVVGTGSEVAYVLGRNQGGADNWGLVARLTAADCGVSGDLSSVAVSGNIALVGAPLDDDTQGAACVFARDQGGTNNWGYVTKLTAFDGESRDKFGYSVAVGGDNVVVGAYYDVGVADSAYQGSAYVFARNQGGTDNWGLVTKLTAEGWEDFFGRSVATNGGTALIGAPFRDYERGAAYVYRLDASAPSIHKQVTPVTDVPYHGSITYTVTLANIGLFDDSQVLFRDALPGEVDFGSWVEQPAGASVSADVINWSGALSAGDHITFVFSADHVGGYEDTVTNMAEFDSTQQDGSSSATFSVVELCEPITDVDLTLVTTGTLYTGSPIQVEVDLAPAGASPDYQYILTVDGQPREPMSASEKPLNLEHTFLNTGPHTVEVAAWNCEMSQADAIADTIDLRLYAPGTCVRVTDVTLSRVPSGAVFSGTPVAFSADISPDDASLPYTYTIYLDKGSLIYPQSGTVDPLAFTHVFPQTGTHSVDVGIWNCGMNETEAITDGVSLSVVEPDCLIYMPVVLKDY